MAQQKNYVIGRGKVYLDQFLPGTQTPTGERYIGNTPSLSMNSAYQDLDHYNADEGLSEKDDSVQIRVDRNGSFSCDNINMDNVGVMFGAFPATETVTAASGLAEIFTVKTGLFYQLGKSLLVPDGVGNVSAVVVTDNTGLHAFGNLTFGANPAPADTLTVNGQAITFVAGAPGLHQVQIGGTNVITAQRVLAEINAYPGLYAVEASGIENVITVRAIASGVGGNAITLAKSGAQPVLSGATLSGGSASGIVPQPGNYEVDLARGRVHILEDAADIADNDVLEIAYDRGLLTRETVIDDKNQVEGSLRFIAENPRGPNKDYFWTRVKLTPAGEYQLKGDTWQTMTFNFTVLEPVDGRKRVYVREAVE